MSTTSNVLAIDLSASEISVCSAIVEKGVATTSGTVQILQSIQEGRARLDSFEFQKIVAPLLQSNPTKLLIGMGPGSFTGLRIALAFIKGVALASEGTISIIGYSSLHGLLAQQEDPSKYTAVRDAARGEYFVQKFSDTEARIVGADTLLQSSDLLLVDDGAELKELEACRERIEFSKNISLGLCALYANNFGIQKIATSMNEIAALDPDYVRKPFAKKISER